MNCMKCGREIPFGQVFCKDCLTEMESHPVKPGTPVQLPVHKPAAAPRRQSSSRKSRKPEEQIIRLRRTVRALIITLLAVILASALSISVLVYLMSQTDDGLLPGQNFSTVEKT